MRTTSKSPEAFRTISEVADALELPQHVLRFWETKFSQIKPLKRAGGRRYYRPEDMDLLRGIRTLLYTDGFTIKGVQKVLREQGVRYVMETGRMAGRDDRPLPVSHSGQIEAVVEPQLIVEAAPEDAPQATTVHRLSPIETAPAPEPGLTSRKRAALESILEELLELKFTLDGARKILSHKDGAGPEAFEEEPRIQHLA